MLYRFGSFEFDSQTRLLFRKQERIPLTPKAADLLLVLLEHQNQLLSKDELLRLVWPGAFVEEGSLSKHIFLLRKTLGEVIETVPKRGYRFIGPVEHPAEGNGTQITIEENTREQIVITEENDAAFSPARGTRVKMPALVCLAMLLAGSLAWAIWVRRTADPELRSLLVLPFTNVGGKAENEYFSDGLTEELITAFSGVPGLRVIPRTTAFQFKGKPGDLQSIGRQLGVQSVLEGGVQREGDRLRIHVVLTRMADGQNVWSNIYDRQAQDVFAMEDEVTAAVQQALFPNDPRSADALSLRHTPTIEAHNSYLKANFVQQTQYKNEEALTLYQKATELDPNYPNAWAGVAFCFLELGYGYQRYPKDVLPLAVQAVQRALRLDPRLAFAHAIQGYLNGMFLRDFRGAEQEFETAISLDPNYGETHHWMSHYWVARGQMKKAEEESRRALECDPLNFGISGHQVWIKYVQGRFPEAIRVAEDMLRLQPLHVPTNWYQMRAHEENGQFEQAIAIRRRMGWTDPPLDTLAESLDRNGPGGYWRLMKESWLRHRHAGPARPIEMAWICAHLGERQEALDWLQQSVEERDPWALYMNVEPPFAWLRSDPRFQVIASEASLP